MDFNEAKAKIKEAYNILELVEHENVTLTLAGPNDWKGLCPFHNEKTPSFHVNEAFQNYKCFGCGVSGDIFTFIQESRGCTFFEALKFLADEKGIEITGLNYNKDEGPKTNLKRLYSLLEETNKFYRNEYLQLSDAHPAKKEVLRRGLSAEDPVFGFAPERYGALNKHLTDLGFTKEEMIQAEMVGEKNGSYYDFFHGRLTITLSDFSGRPVSYSARKLFEKDTQAKFVNGKASPIFQKKGTLFNLHEAKKTARQKGELIIAEGPFDVMAIRDAGLPHSVASCGTAFTEDHLKAARQLVGENGTLIFAFDGDDAGIEAAKKIFTHFPVAHSSSKVALFPEGLDPCDFLQEKGAEELKGIINNAEPLTDFVLKMEANAMESSNMASRYNFIKVVVSKYLSIMTDDVLLNYMIRKASVMAGISIEKIKELLVEYKKTKGKNFIERETPTTSNKLELKVNIDPQSESDVSFVNALSLLISSTDLLIPVSAGHFIPEKFRPFLGELAMRVKHYRERGVKFRFIAEEYTDADFAKLLQNRSQHFLSPTDEKDAIEHYLLILEAGERFYNNEERERRRLEVSRALAEATTNEEIIALLKELNNK